jgi:hypothetical protein
MRTPSAINPRPRTGLWLAGFLLVCFVYFLPRPGDWPGDSRLDLTLSLGNRGAAWIDGYQWNTGIDSAYYHGHYYALKAPGQSLVGVPIYLGYRALLSLSGNGTIANQIGKKRTWNKTYSSYYLLQSVETMYTVAFPAVLVLLLFFWFLGYFSTSVPNRILLTLSLGLATSFFPYAQVLYPHVPSCALTFLAFVLIYVVAHPERARERKAEWFTAHSSAAILLAGLALGTSVLFDHTSVIVGALIVVYALPSLPLRQIPYLALGALPPLACLLAFDAIAYHNPFVTGYSTAGQGVGGSDANGKPGPSGLYGLTLSPYRGLFFVSPFLLLALPGYFWWWRRGDREWLLFALAPGALLLAVASVPYWYGGVAVGPRYLVPVLPFLAVPIIFVLDRATRWQARAVVYAIIALSFATVWLETLGGKGYPAVGVSNPLFSISLPAFARGDLPLSLGTVLVYPFAGMNTKWTLLPLLTILLLWTWLCFRKVISLQSSVFGRTGGWRLTTGD